jgi:hypothetical protein
MFRYRQGRAMRFFNSPNWVSDPLSFLFHDYGSGFPRISSSLGVNLKNHLHQVPTSRVSGGIPLISLYVACTGETFPLPLPLPFKVKLNFTMEQATKAQKRSRFIAPADLPPGKTRYPLYRRMGGPQGGSGPVRKISPTPGFGPRTFQPTFTFKSSPYNRPPTRA